MQPAFKSALAVGAALFLGMAFSTASQAQEWRYRYQAYPDVYQNPDGTYDSLADLSRDVWGVPCGIECTRDAQARWARYGYRLSHSE
jgi:hypothetical protein